MKTDLYIPTKIKIGFVNREDTFTQKLAYLIYYDEKNVLRKQTSWDNWRDHNIPTIEIENKPLSGFVFNKGVQRYGYHSNSGRAVARVHDPRNFEFEISIENMFGIMMNNDILKRDIQGEFVYAWSGKDLILLPTSSLEYKSSQAFTEKQYKSLTTKDLVKGKTYIKKKSTQEYVYMGYFNWYEINHYNMSTHSTHKGKKHVFYYNNNFHHFSIATLAEAVSDDITEKYPKLLEDFQKSKYAFPLNNFRQDSITGELFGNKINTSGNRFYYKNFGQDKMEAIMINPYSGLTKLSPSDKICTYLCKKLSNNSYENLQSSYLTADKIIAKYPEMRTKMINHKVIFGEDVMRYLNDEGFKVITLTADNGFERRI
jgi:hypothetical protein